MKTAGLVVGRLTPIHLGHVKTINEMITNHGINDSLIILGSANSSISLRNPLSYVDRKKLIRNIFPEIKIIGLGDQDCDHDWSESLMDILQSVFPDYDEIVLYTGSHLDITKFHLDGIKISIVDRTKLNISATEVRNKIYHHLLSGNYRAEFLNCLKDILPLENIHETLDLISKNFQKMIEGKI